MKKHEQIKLVSALVLAAAICLSGCASPSQSVSSSVAAKQYSATAKGFGGDVCATLTFEENKITEVLLTGDQETESIGGAALETLKEQVIATQSAEIDGVSGATLTSNAVKEAVAECIAQASGKTAAPANVTDGVYTGTAMGFKGNVTVEVTVKDQKIKEINVTDIQDTYMIGQAAATQLVQQIVESQSLSVDSISGATVTSGAVFSAVSAALKEAGADSKTFNGSVEKRAPQTTELTTQVVVIGAGMAGISAAIEAAEQGADIILLEKSGVFSGSTTRSEGFVMGAGTSIQEEYGVEDSADAMYEDMYELYQQETTLDTTLLRKSVDESAELIDWLVDHGVNFVDLEAISNIAPRDVRRAHVSENKGDGLTEALVAALDKNDKITVYMNTPATEIIVENNAVIGVKATNQFGDDITIHAGATILCAGSYGANQEMVSKLNSSLVPVTYTGCGDGDGWTLAENAGAKMMTIGYMASNYTYCPYNFLRADLYLPGSPCLACYDVIQTDTTGNRLVNEDAFTFDFGDALYNSGDPFGWAIGGEAFNEKYPDLYTAGEGQTLTINGKEYQQVYKADTLEELAELTGMDVDTLKATVERYNASCDAGVDEEFGKDPQYMVRVDGSYYAYIMPLMTSDGYSGCCINENAQVLDANDQPIEGFYAAGACALPQIIGNRYFGCGSLLMTCGVYGRTAGEQAANFVKN